MDYKDGTFTPLRHRVFRELWLASMVSNLGSLIQAVGAGWLMTSLSDSSNMVALVQASTTLPIMMFALFAGALADNFNRRRIVLTAQLFMFAVSVVLAVFAWQGWLTPFMLLGFTFLIGCGASLNNPAWQASMGDIVPREDLSSAVSLNSMAFNLMRSVGPALGGFIVAVLGAAAAFTVNAFTYVAMIFAIWRWRPIYPENTLPRETVHHAVVAGLRYFFMSPNLMKVFLRGLVFGFGAVAVMALMPLIARDMLGAGATTYGMLLGFFGFGAIGGALTNAQLRLKYDSETIVRGSFVAFALSLIALSFSHITAVTCLLLMVAGACWVLTLSLLNVSVQLSTPRWVVGRALALYQMATFGGMAGGSWIWGWLAERTDLPVALLGAGLVLILGAGMGLWLRLPDLGIVNLDPLNRFKEPDLRLDLTHRSGPIMVMVDYEIEQKDVPEFLKWMTLRRRVRIRDGARQWALLRDLENPDIWTESYHVPTWIEYVRHNLRRTQADAEVADRLRALHKGEEAPRVHRMIERQTVPVRDDMPLKPLTEPH